MPAIVPDWLDPLREQLLPALLQAGLDIDTRTRLNIEAWLHAAQERALLSPDPICARGALRAIVSKSAREQQLFDQVFDAWRKRWDHAAEVLGEVKTLTKPEATPNRASAAPAASRARGPIRALVAGLVVVGGVAIIGPMVWPPADSTGQIAPKPVPLGNSGQAPSALDLSKVAFVGKLEVQRPPWLFGIPPWAYGLLVLGLGCVGGFVRHTRQVQLARISTRENLREQQVFARQLLPVSGERRAALRTGARGLRKPRPTELRVLDIDASTRATACRAGAFVPVHRLRTATPEYLFLVDRAASGDQQAHWAAEMARDLAAEGVNLALYEFDRDPRWVAPLDTRRSAGRGVVQRYLPLAALASRHAGNGLIVVGDGHALIDPAIGALHPWLNQTLKPWPRRVLMTPRPPAGWGAAEDVLAGEGQPAHEDAFLLLPARIDMLAAASRWFDFGEIPEVTPLPGAPSCLPAVLDDDDSRWIGREAPANAQLVDLLEQIRGFLGPTAYTWLAASAAYPHLSADLTAYLAHQLDGTRSDARLLEARLLGIAQLPWCRFGLMPDWLRRALFLSLAPATRERVRAVLAQLFHAAGRDDTAFGVALGVVASGDAGGAKRGRQTFLRDLRRRIGLSGVVENEPPDSPLRDVIYLGVLRGDFDPVLSLEATEEFARAVRAEFGTRLTRNPLRWIAALVLSAAHPFVWLVWWGRGPLLGKAMGLGRGLRQTWREAYAGAEGGYAALGRGLQRIGRRLLGAQNLDASRDQSGPLVYLSYSRSEAGHVAERLHDSLVRRLGQDAVWSDVTLSAGTSLGNEIRGAIGSCKVLVVILTRDFFQRDESFQLLEIQTALDAGKPIVPVLSDDVTMPAADDLPPALRPLVQYQAFALRSPRMETDLEGLTDAIVRALGRQGVAR